jgi:hypothetical protein
MRCRLSCKIYPGLVQDELQREVEQLHAEKATFQAKFKNAFKNMEEEHACIVRDLQKRLADSDAVCSKQEEDLRSLHARYVSQLAHSCVAS